jgi:hypothetical protein
LLNFKDLPYGKSIFFFIWIGIFLIEISSTKQVQKINDDDRIKPYTHNPKYWQYKGQPVMLLGANKTDSPFLLPDQEAYYDSLANLSGNYTRYNIKQRLVSGLLQKFPFLKLDNGLYDLNRWDDGYWNLFEQGLMMTRDRGIIVQLELWDRFDVGCDTYYIDSPWRPANNVTYSESDSELPDIWRDVTRCRISTLFILRFQQWKTTRW